MRADAAETMSLLSALAASFSSGSYCAGSSRTEGLYGLDGLDCLGALEAILRSPDTPPKVLRSACALLVRFVSKDIPRISSAIATPGLVRTLCDIASRRSGPKCPEASSASDALCALGILPAPSIVTAGNHGPQAIEPLGPLGPAGTHGPIGPAGAHGPIGPAGAHGPICPIGTHGPIVPIGPIGPIGPTKTQSPANGLKGLTGITGPAKTHVPCLACACEALDFESVRAALVPSGTGAGTATGHESKCCATKLSPLAVCAHMAKHDPECAARIMRLLISHSAKVARASKVERATEANVQCPMGLTPLHWASTPGVALILLEHGSDPRIRDKKGRTALEYHRELDAREELEKHKTGVARVIAAYERNVTSATLERSASRKIKRDAGRDEKAKRARTVA